MPPCDCEKTIEILLRIRTSLNRQKVDDLYEKFCLTITRITHCFNQLLQSWQEPIMTDAQQWSTRNVAYPRSFNHQRSGSPFSESPIPIKIILRNESVCRRTPRHHRGNPGAAHNCQWTNLNRFKQQGLLCL